jgi:hypothetical protein
MFLKSAWVAGCGASALARTLVAARESTQPDRLILSTPLTHSDWILKAGIPWGEAGAMSQHVRW